MSKSSKKPFFMPFFKGYQGGSESLLPHKPLKQPLEAVFSFTGHTLDTLQNNLTYFAVKKMKAPSEPAINKDNPNLWFVYYNIDVPFPLWHKYPRKRIRIKEYDDINSYTGEEKEKYAEFRRRVWKYALEVLKYNPFEDELAALNNIKSETVVVEKEVARKEALSAEQLLKLTPVADALDKFVNDKKDNIKNVNTLSTYTGVVKWLKKYFEQQGLSHIPINEVSRLQIAGALNMAKKEGNRGKPWGPTTYNNNIDFANTVFNWLVDNDYMDKNPGKQIKKVREKKTKHKWYDRDIFRKVQNALLDAGEIPVYRAMGFTYFIWIRSQSELLQLKFADIDRTLKRVRFSEELSKNDTEQYRDYDPEFDEFLDEMEFDKYPKNWYIFGKNGEPSPIRSGKNYLANHYRPIREALELSDKYTIYSMKHTGIIHAMMKGMDGYAITYKARHETIKTTDDYKRDYDFTLANIYKPEDLEWYYKPTA